MPNVDQALSPSQHSESSALVYGSEIFPSSVGSTSYRNSQRLRPDIGTLPAHHRTIRIDAARDHLQEDGVNANDNSIADPNVTSKLYIWGTRICVAEVQRAFRSFLTEFKTDQVEDDENALLVAANQRMEVNLENAYYMERLMEIEMSENILLNLNLQHVAQFNESLYKMIIAYPADIIPYLDLTVNDLFFETYNKRLNVPIETRPFNAEQTKNVRDLNPQDMDQLITISGMVVRISPLIPEMHQGHFECSICHYTVENEVDRGRIDEPVTCLNCNNTYCFQLIHNKSIFNDKQTIKLQEIPGDLPTGLTPHTVTLFVHGSLVESVHPGDRVAVTGIYRATPIRVNPRQRSVKSIFRTSIDVLHFRKMNQNRLHEANDGSYLPEERIAEILELSKNPDIVDRLANAIAPSIFGHHEIKKGILCLLFGGTRKSDSEGNRAKLRSEINLLLCGDPGTAKSQLLQYVYRLVPRSQYTSGKGSSAVGLSASITRDPDTRGVVLQTGALVLSDNGVCCIDEFDKMNDSTRTILHEVMEQQTLSIAKAGIICQLNARTSILAAANPIDSKWNTKKTIIDNIQLPHTLLSRFDLIFLMLDPQDETYDRRLAKHLVSLYDVEDQQEQNERLLDMALLRDYISYAKENIHPQITEMASTCLIDKYLSMRKMCGAMGQVTAYPRQLESLVRLSEALAKMRLSNYVNPEDVEAAYNLHREALLQSAVDPETGVVNVNIIAAGISSTSKKIADVIKEKIRQELEQRHAPTLSGIKLFREMRQIEKIMDRALFEEALKALEKDEVITRNGDKIRFRPVGN